MRVLNRAGAVAGDLANISSSGAMQEGDLGSRELISQYRTLLETSIDGFFINVDGHFHYVNPAFQRMLGARSEAELLGRRVLDHIDPASHDAVRARVRQCETSSEPVMPLEEKYVRVDGSLIDVEVTAVAITRGGKHAGLVTVRDISARRQAERAQRSLEEQLRHAQKLEALGTLAGGVAHDFNNILTAIVGNAEVALANLDPAHPASRCLGEILAATRRAKGVTAQVLAFSRREPPQLRVLDLRATVAEELSLVASAAPPGTRLEERLEPGQYPVLTDATQIHQVLLNLCTNAWQAFAGQPGRVTIRLRRCRRGEDGVPADLSPGGHAALSVEDDGPGIDESILERIFDPFFTTKQTGHGTGLGLSVVHGIAKSHGARITCTSRVGFGTTFCLYLALVEPVPAPAPMPSARTARRSRPSILFLDDEVDLVLLAEKLLRTRGYRVLGFTDPAVALEALRSHRKVFDLLITDFNMPAQTGLDVAQAAHGIARSLPVIVLSGMLDDNIRARLGELGVHAVLDKPVDTDLLCRTIEGLLGTNGRSPSSAVPHTPQK